MEEFKQRLATFIESYCKLSQRRFEERCGLANGTITSIKVKGPSAEIVSKISYVYPELNLNWLFRGETGGSMLLEAEPSTRDLSSLAITGNGSGVITNDKEIIGKFLSIIEEKDRQIATLIQKL